MTPEKKSRIGFYFASGHDPEWVAEELFFGAGCCSPLNTERRR